MPEVTIKPADPIVPGRPSWFVYVDGEFVARVWEDAGAIWSFADAGGHPVWCGKWANLCVEMGLPHDTPRPKPADIPF